MATIVTRAGKGSPLTNTEVDDNFTNLNTDKLEKSGGTMTGDLTFGDNDKAIFGAGSDLEIYHNGTDSKIYDGGTGNLTLESNGTQIELKSTTGDMVRAVKDDEVVLFYSGSRKLATTATGIDVTGNVVSDGASLDGAVVINESGADVDFRIESDTNANAFFLEGSSGNVGIGTASPSASLQLGSTSKTADSMIYTAAGNGAYKTGLVYETSGQNAGFVGFNKTGSTYLGIPDSTSGFSTTSSVPLVFATNNNERMRIDSSGNVGIGITPTGGGGGKHALDVDGPVVARGGVASNQTSAGALDFVSDVLRVRSWGATSGTGEIAFRTGGGDGSVDSEAMRIDSSGNVGIGEDDPKTILHTYGTSSTTYDPLAVGGQNTSATLRIQNASTAANTFSSIDFNTNNNRVVNRIVSSHGSTTTDGFLAFITEGSGITAEAMRIDSSGNVGIGTSSPGSILHTVGGNVRIDGDGGANTARLQFVPGSSPSDGSTISSTYVGTGSYGPIKFVIQTERMRIDSSGNLLVGGTTNPLSTKAAIHGTLTIGADQGGSILYFDDATVASSRYRLRNSDISEGDFHIQKFDGTSSWDSALYINSSREVRVGGTTDNGAYNLQCNGTGVWGQGAYVNGSDERMKQNIADLNDGLEIVNQLRPVTYQYREEFSKDRNTQPGFIAQELQQVLDGKDYKDGVVPAGPEYLNVAYQNLIPILTKAIQEQQAIIEALETRIAALESN
jgi:hypothetical protein